MKGALLFACSSILLLAAAQQNTFPEPLATDLAKLATAKSVTVSYTYLVNNEPQGKWKLTMSRDDLFRLTYPGGFVLSDGKSVYSYDKAKNSYTVAAFSDGERSRFMSRPDVFGWAAFLAKNPGSDIQTATAGQSHSVRGTDVQDAVIVLKNGKGSGSIFVDTKLGVARGFRLKVADKEYMAVADSVELSPTQETADKYAFVAPDGATQVEATSSEATFASVQKLFSDNCMPCHDSSNQRAGLDVTSYDSIVANVSAGHSADSLIIKALTGNGAAKMPKGRPALSDDQVQLVSKWIDAGAKKD